MLHATSARSEIATKAMGTAGSPIMSSSIRGSSAVIAPDGRVLNKEESPSEKLIFADLDLNLVTKIRTFADAGGHYELSKIPTLSPQLT